MSRVFTDADLMTWEAYTSSGQWGFPDEPRIIFHCLSDPGQPVRYIQTANGMVEAARSLHDRSSEELRAFLQKATPL